MRIPFKALCLSLLTLALPCAAQAQVAASAASPPLTPALCPAGLAPVSHNMWKGEMPRWTPASGRPMLRVDLPGPNAVCNDGTPAAIYVRPAPNTLPNGNANPLRDMYHIHFKGGGSCRSFEECRQRYCNEGGKQTNKPGLMSSRGWRARIAGTGLFIDHPNNRFSFANQVLIGYCTSDTYIGSAPAGTAVSVDPSDPVGSDTAIAFMGEHVTKAVFDTLDTGITVSQPQDDTTYEFKPLRDMRRIFITGDSGGANGARHHLDRIAARYPEAMVIGGLDAGGGIDMSDSALDFGLLTPPTNFTDFMSLRVKQARSFQGVDDSALDSSCKAANPGGGFDEQACFNGFELSRDHVTTPMIIRQSLRDSAGGIGALIAAPNPDPIQAALTFDGLQEITAQNPVISALGANCKRHVAFRNSNQVRRMETLTGGLVLYKEIELWAFSCFATGTCPKMVTLAPPVQPVQSTCP